MMQNKILSNDQSPVSISEDENFYDEWVAKEWWSEAERRLLMYKLKPRLYKQYRHMCIPNFALSVYQKYNFDFNMIPSPIPDNVILDDRSPNYRIPDELKEIITIEFVKLYMTLHNYQTSQKIVRLNDGNAYDRGHPYVVILDAYSKNCIDEKHPLFTRVNERYKRQTGEYLIAIKELVSSNEKNRKSDQWIKFYSSIKIRNNDFLDRANKIRNNGEKNITKIQAKLQQEEIGRTDITLSVLKKTVTNKSLQQRRLQYSKR